jgi:glycosyltransferase involved in cell wall biosynthesis
MSPDLDQRIAVIVWAAAQDRARGYAQVLNAPVYFVSRTPFGSNARLLTPLRYFLQVMDTWSILGRQKPALIHVTNPPFLAPLIVYLYCRLSGAKYIMDTHSPALYSRRWGWTFPIQRYLARRAYLNVVDQERYKQMFEAFGARAVVLQRALVDIHLPPPAGHATGKPIEITVINTFAPDEPLQPIYQAAASLKDVHFYVLGDKRFATPGTFDNVPENVTFTGYLRGDDYWQRIVSSNAIMCLTTYPYSLLAGGQDGMMAGVPLIVSEQPVLRDYFTHGTVFVENTAASIVEGVERIRCHEQDLRREISELFRQKRLLWDTNFQIFNQIVQGGL